MSERVVLHIGVHKTGTTSIQNWAHQNRDDLRTRLGLDVYSGRIGARNHIEFPLLCMRSDRNLHARVMHPDSCLPSWQTATRRHVAEQLDSPAPSMFVSAESLSFLRYPDELAALRDLLGPREVRVIVFLRDPQDYLRSYRAHVVKMGYSPSVYPESFNYVEPDTWLVDFDGLIAAYTDAFGADAMTVLSYEDAVAEHGSTIPAVAQAAGLSIATLPDWQEFWLNPTPEPVSLVGRARRAIRSPRATVMRRVERWQQAR
jgi:hypothetical protein